MALMIQPFVIWIGFAYSKVITVTYVDTVVTSTNVVNAVHLFLILARLLSLRC